MQPIFIILPQVIFVHFVCEFAYQFHPSISTKLENKDRHYYNPLNSVICNKTQKYSRISATSIYLPLLPERRFAYICRSHENFWIENGESKLFCGGMGFWAGLDITLYILSKIIDNLVFWNEIKWRKLAKKLNGVRVSS